MRQYLTLFFIAIFPAVFYSGYRAILYTTLKALEFKYYFSSLGSVFSDYFNTAKKSLLVLLVIGVTPAYSIEFSNSYDYNITLDISSVPVFKFVDSKGKTSYSSDPQDDFVTVERISITPPPSAEYVEQAQLRSSKLQRLAEQLSQAREKREALREEKEKQRLQRLALLNQSKPQVYERNIYLGYPYRLWRTYPDGGNHKPHKPHRPVKLPAARPNASQLPLPSSSFSSALR